MAHHTPILSVDLEAIAANWRLLSARHAKGQCAAVVKANAYGLGMIPVAERLAQAGCQTFFVATLEEGIALREAFRHCEKPQATRQSRMLDCFATARNDKEIFVFGGLLKGEEKDYAEYHLSPVLNTLEQVECAHRSSLIIASSALHIDTGMCRLGLNPSEVAGAPIQLLMTHLACASDPAHPLNAEQLRLFEAARQHFPNVPCSMAISSGMFLGQEFHYDLGRPGCSLYGITPNPDLPNPMQQVATLTAPILQCRIADRDQTVGYGGTASIKKGQKVLTVGMGYADGLHRIASNSEMKIFVGDYALPLLGRVSMDLTCWDASAVPDSVLEAATHVTLLDERQPVDRLAEICHTIGYEILTSIGNRVRRDYQWNE